jgi:hypothetical protein
MMGDGIGDLAFWLAVGLVGLGFTFGPIGQAVGRWIESRTRREGLPSSELEGRLAELDQMTTRLAEVEERLDFAERLLARGRSEAGGVDTPPEAVDAGR